MRFSHVMLGYFLAGAVMFGGGVISWDQIGIVASFFDMAQSGLIINETQVGNLESIGGVAATVAQLFGAGLLAVLQFVLTFLTFLFWPAVALMQIGAPDIIVLVVGGAVTMAFIGGFLRLLRTSA